MLSIFRAITISLLAGLTAQAQAQAQAATPVLKSIVGQPLRLMFSDGREAVLRVANQKFTNLKIGLTVNESLCAERQTASCSFDLDYAQRTYFFAWTKNPDAAKINRPIVVSNFGVLDSSQIQISLLGAERAFAPKMVADMAPLRMSCNDFSWLPTKTTTAPASLKVVRWEAEFMLQNPETTANENRSISGAFDVQFTRDSAQSMQFTGIRTLNNGLGSPSTAFTFLFAGTSLGLSIDQGNGDTCQATIQTDLSAIQAKVSGVAEPDLFNERTDYIVGSDEALSRPQIFDFRKTFTGLQATAEEKYQ